MIRPARADDRQFIVSSWSASLRSSRDVPLIPMSEWAAVMRPVIARVADREQVLVACNDADPSILYGFICFRPPTYVYYVFVKQLYRMAGVARRLFAAAEIGDSFGYACRTRSSWEVFQAKKCRQAKYDPFFARYDQPKEAT